jgi:DNA excision repair protein ERCC-3
MNDRFRGSWGGKKTCWATPPCLRHLSGAFSSMQEEAQRLGRILRPKSGENQAHFYLLVTWDTVEHNSVLKRQLFLCEQGHEYAIQSEDSFRTSSERKRQQSR